VLEDSTGFKLPFIDIVLRDRKKIKRQITLQSDYETSLRAFVSVRREAKNKLNVQPVSWSIKWQNEREREIVSRVRYESECRWVIFQKCDKIPDVDGLSCLDSTWP